MSTLKYALLSLLAGLLALPSCSSDQNSPTQPPNVILVITDDQGYGDLSAHGNPWLQTPNLDQLHSQSIRFADFHVGTTCAPTRSMIMTGKNCNKVGAWHTIIMRQIPWRDEVMLPELFQEAGYATGMFGKWHLGDNYPYRPQDRGFDEVLMHGGGGVGQTPDYWNNDYFDDTYFRNGEPEKQEGYCTDVWFQAAMDFIEEHREQPFFCYLATNAPHGPFYVDTTYIKPYQDNENIENAAFYGMIANVDENMGRLRSKLEELNLADNTILVFMTDNGTAAGCALDEDGFVNKGYNAGMRGKKGSPYEGGHRVPFFIHWKNGELSTGRDIEQLAAATDIAPTLLDLCGIDVPADVRFDGKSLQPLLRNEHWDDRTLIMDTQRELYLKKYKQYAVMTEQWRLVNGQLFDVQKDPGQEKDVAEDHPNVVEELMAAYENWWTDISARAEEINYFPVGKSVGDRQTLTQHDLFPADDRVAWHQSHIRSGRSYTGYWNVEIEAAGRYRFEVQRWPAESGLGLNEAAPIGDYIPTGLAFEAGKVLNITDATLEIAGQQKETKTAEDALFAVFELDLEPGRYPLKANFTDEKQQSSSAYYVSVSRVN